ncbi:hypothetical protein DUI87_18307 [Hirundo rustica rustica]|uniref:Uncharacterized protein n=1 Tax=Hirundo rustica rustica TaxID=333673 RepID=A0A3M0JWK4_HIRRU|nr:hypothetical protein DUI87_18307 [Hirundo rustica rustica]
MCLGLWLFPRSHAELITVTLVVAVWFGTDVYLAGLTDVPTLIQRFSHTENFQPKNSCLESKEAENLPAHLILVLPAPMPGYKNRHLFSLCFPSCGHGQGNPAHTHEIFYMNFVFLTYFSN